MKLQTEIKLKKQEHNQIDYHSKLLLLGSCFSENIGNKFDYFKFQSISNPFGILFHPKALENLIVRAAQDYQYLEKNIFFHNEQWHCYDAHSKLSNSSKDELLQTLNKQLQLTNKQIISSTHVIITLGTAWVYKLISTGETVANCHKVVQKQFEKSLLSIKEIKQSLESIIKAIKAVNSNAQVIFTVSPVRHIKDGFVENTQSKSHLISAVHQITDSEVFYFPSYEIMLDELRDYRFYKDDMVHPNTLAVNYIWEKFQEVWISSEAKTTILEVDAVQKGLQHKPFNVKSQAHQVFLQQLKQKQDMLKSQFSHFKFY